MENIQYSRFAVNERPYCVWEWDLRERNAVFLDALDPDYFEYLATAHAEKQPDEQGAQRAAVALRLSYSHGLESFFAILFAALQAPDCVGGWLLRYRASDLRELIIKVGRGRSFYSKIVLAPMTWESIADCIHQVGPSLDEETTPDFKRCFGQLWAGFARDYLQQERTDEYNSLKHGFRIAPGGFFLRIGQQSEEGVPAPPESMRSAGGSRFGSTFFKPEFLSNDKRHFRIRRQSINWIPENHFHGLRLLALSMNNVINFIKLVTGAAPAESLSVAFPDDEEYFKKPWQLTPGVTGFGYDLNVPPSEIHRLSPEEILDIYKANEGDISSEDPEV